MIDHSPQETPAPISAAAPELAPAVAWVSAKPQAAARLRLWPGVLIVALQWVVLLVPGWLAPGTVWQMYSMMLSPMVGALGVVLWWTFFSRLRWAHVGIGLVAFFGIAAATFPLLHWTLQEFPVAWLMRALMVVPTAWVAWLLLTPFLNWRVRQVGLAAVFLVTWGLFVLLRFEGVTGGMSLTLVLRGTDTAEEKFLAEHAAKMSKGIASGKPAVLAAGDWPGFRGPNRDGRLPGVRIATDWDKHPPKLLWEHRVGPGWSSFAVVGNRLYTQEQHGENEAVVCYETDTGEKLWVHLDHARFYEALGGPGPRATPTFSDGKIYALGATGKLNCLDAVTGEAVWARDVPEDAGAKVPDWGYASSPLVVQGVVTVYGGGPDKKSVLGYDASSGSLMWSAAAGPKSYCSMQRANVDGVEQLVIATAAGLTAFQPKSGEILWQYEWETPGMPRVAQPALIGDSDFLLGTVMDGTRRIHLNHSSNKWTPEQVWPTRAIKPYYNDLVVHKEHLYGFDSEIFTCVSLDKGKGKWRARGYGNGQVLLLADQDLLLILSEKGAVALVEANPEEHRELVRFQALVLEDERKTWNHPVIAHGKLFVRNDAEAACYQLNVIGPDRDDYNGTGGHGAKK